MKTIREKIGKRTQRITALLGMTVFLSAGLAGCGQEAAGQEAEKAGFVPSLDTEKSVTLEVAGFMGNFEALDQVINEFNEYYPNVSVTYEQNSAEGLAEYLKSNPTVDIFMTNEANVRYTEGKEELWVAENCLDLSKEDVDAAAIDEELLQACTVDGELLRIPLAKIMCGMVVNQTLLEQEGLKMPQNYEEFLEVCEALKEKGYVPIQGSRQYACSDMILPMAMSIIGNKEDLTKKVNEKDDTYADSLLVVYERLETLLEKGYLTDEKNSAYPDDNYEGAILNFFEGDVPFWIANTEKFSGMKKRESKSEAFSAQPFEYEFVNVPLGEEGVYDYEEPWFGFSVNKNGLQIDYAVEFMDFLMQEKELNLLAQVKGMPSVTIQNSDERFTDALHPDNLQDRYVYNGKMSSIITAYIADTGNQMGKGAIADAQEAVQTIKERIKE